MEQPEEPPVEDRRNVRARFHDFSQRDADHERNDDPMLAVNPLNAPQGGQYHEGGPSNVSPPTVSSLQQPQNAGGPLNPWKTPNPVIAPPRTDAEPTPTLTDVNPENGSITGGTRIWLQVQGMDFPAHFPLFARFGTAVVTVGQLCLRNLCYEPRLTKFLRPTPLASFLPVVCPPQPPQVLSMLRYRSIPSQMRRNMEPVSRSFDT